MTLEQLFVFTFSFSSWNWFHRDSKQQKSTHLLCSFAKSNPVSERFLSFFRTSAQGHSFQKVHYLNHESVMNYQYVNKQLASNNWGTFNLRVIWAPIVPNLALGNGRGKKLIKGGEKRVVLNKRSIVQSAVGLIRISITNIFTKGLSDKGYLGQWMMIMPFNSTLESGV